MRGRFPPSFECLAAVAFDPPPPQGIAGSGFWLVAAQYRQGLQVKPEPEPMALVIARM
jgi:hypothetical protein